MWESHVQNRRLVFLDWGTSDHPPKFRVGREERGAWKSIEKLASQGVDPMYVRECDGHGLGVEAKGKWNMQDLRYYRIFFVYVSFKG